jgi:adenylate cyclase
MFRSKSYLLILLLFLMCLLTLGVAFQRPVQDLRNFIFDTYQRASPQITDPDRPVAIVDIDEDSLTKLGQWPWPRTRMADIVSRLQDAGAATIVFDIVFSEDDRTSPEKMLDVIQDIAIRQRLQADIVDYIPHDRQFAERILNANVVLAATYMPEGMKRMPPSKSGFAMAGDPPEAFLPSFESGIAPLPILLESAAGLGATNWLPDRDQVIRSVPLLLRSETGLMPSLVLESLRVVQGASSLIVRSSNASGQTAFGSSTGINAIKVGSIEIPTGSRGEVRVKFSKVQKDRYMSAASVIAGNFDANAIQGRIVLIGTSAAGLADLRATPLEAAIPGVEVHAQILEHILRGKGFYRPDWMLGVEWILAILLGISLWMLLPLTSVLTGAIIGSVVAAAMVGISFWLFNQKGLHFDPAFPSLCGLGAYLMSSATLWQVERSTRTQLRHAFGKFLAPSVIERLVENPERLVLGGETRDMTILFSDLRNFTGMSEGLDARQLTTFMNAYLTPMTDIILDSGGTVDKYIGDAIIAFWNAPLDDSDHAEHAVQSALDMRVALERLNKQRNARGETSMHFGIGINSGPCNVGNMGSSRRFDYSVLGDTVNLTSRIEGLSKNFGVDILASKELVQRTKDFAWLKVGDVRVKGKKQMTELYLLCGNKDYAKNTEFQNWQKHHEAMLEDFTSGNVSEALAQCLDLNNRMPHLKQELYGKMIERLSKVLQSPSVEKFDPVQIF